MSSHFKVIQLPRRYDSSQSQKLLRALAEKSKILRLEALKTNPEAFSSTYEREIAFEDVVWEDRLKNPSARTFVGLDLGNHEHHDTEDEKPVDFAAAIAAPWVGVIVLLGPRALDGAFPTASESPWKLFHGAPVRWPDTKDDTPKTRLYLINAVYVSPSVRGKGVGRKLIQEVLRTARDEFGKERALGEEGVCMIFVEKDNNAATGLYKACGFDILGEEDYTSLNGKMGRSVALMQKI
jgi:ribosomal protein S18 acetylase RimI-like enzyme